MKKPREFKHMNRWSVGKVRCGFFDMGPMEIRVLVVWKAGPRDITNYVNSLKLTEHAKPDGFTACCWSFEDEGKDPDNYTPPDELPATHALLFAKPLDVMRSLYGINCISHECHHLIDMAFRLRGLELNDGSEEAYTYHTAWAVERVCQLMRIKL